MRPVQLGGQFGGQLALLLALFSAAPAVAETAMTADEFEAFATGNTLTYQGPDGVFGTEEYLPGRKVRWSDGSPGCRSGLWYPKDGNICFYYRGTAEPACWTLLRTGGKVTADIADEPGDRLYEVMISKEALPCNGLQAGD